MVEAVEDVANLNIFRKLMNVNYFGCVDTISFALPYLNKTKGGRILALSSVGGKVGVPLKSGYCASKHALHGFLDSLRIEVESKHGTKVIIVCPSAVNSPNRMEYSGDGNRSKITREVDHGDSLQTVSSVVVDSLECGDRERYITLNIKLGTWIQPFFPGLLDKIIIRGSNRMYPDKKY